MIHDDDDDARVVRMVQADAIETQSGAMLPTPVDSVCVHGDTPAAVGIAVRVRAALERDGIAVKPFAPVP